MPKKTLKAGLRKLSKQKRAVFHKEMPNAGVDLITSFPVKIDETSIIAGYLPIQNEIDPIPLLKYLSGLGARLCLPRLNKITNSLNFHLFEFGDCLEKGDLGVQEPKYDKKTLNPTIMLVPLLAFDKNGFRLGYGGGYYDKAINSAEEKGGMITIGLAYSGQKVDNLPLEDHDKALDFVLTEQECFRFGE